MEIYQNPFNAISEREKEVLHLITHEYSTKEIAKELYISFDTVKTHRKHLMEKLGVRNTAGLVREGFRQGIISLVKIASLILLFIQVDATGISAQNTVLNDREKNFEWRTRRFTIDPIIGIGFNRPTFIFEARLDNDNAPNALFGSRGSGADHCVRWGDPIPSSHNEVITCISETNYNTGERGPITGNDDVDFHFRAYHNDGSTPRCESNGKDFVFNDIQVLRGAFLPGIQTSSIWSPFPINGSSSNIILESTWRYTHGNTVSDALTFGELADETVYVHENHNRKSPTGASVSMGYTDNNILATQNSTPDVYYNFSIAGGCKTVVIVANNNFGAKLYLAKRINNGQAIAITESTGSIIRDLYEGDYIIIVEGQSTSGYFYLQVYAEDISSNPLSAGSISTSSTPVCAGANLPSITGISGGSTVYGHQGALTYEWQKKIGTNNWQTVFNESSNTLTNTGTMGTADVKFRRRTVGCGYTSSWTNETTVFYTAGSIIGGSVTLNGASVIPEIPGGIDPGSISNTASATGDPTPIAYLWEQSINNGSSWSNAPGSNTSTGYNIPAITQTTQYRRKATNACSGSDYSNVITVEVVPADGAISGRVTSPAGINGAGAGVAGVIITATRTTSVPSGNLTSSTYTTTTDNQGYYTISDIYYGDDQADFTITPSKVDGGITHIFNPSSLTNQTIQTTFKQLSNKDFVDETAFSFTGIVHQIFNEEPDPNAPAMSKECGLDSVVIYLNNIPLDTTGIDGNYSIAIPNIGNHTIRAEYIPSNHTFQPNEYNLYIDRDYSDQDFEDVTTFSVSGFSGGSCDAFLGQSTWLFKSLDGCICREVTTYTDGTYLIELPARQYEVSLVEFPNPIGYEKVEVEAFFNGTRRLDLRSMDQTMDFIYRPPPRVEVTGFPDPQCNPEVIVLEQLQSFDITIQVFEGVGDCPVDTGVLVIVDQISDRQNETIEIPFTNGEATYTVVPGTPNIIAPHYKGFTLQAFDTTTVNFENPGEYIIDNALVTGVRPREQTFTTVTPQIPLMILRDPPGDASYSSVTQSMTNELATRFYNKEDDGINVWGEIRIGAKFTVGVGFAQETEIWGTVGDSYTVSKTSVTTEESILSIETTETFATSGSEDIIGEKGDVFVGGAMNMLYAAADVVSFDNCQVETNVDLVIANDGFATTYIYTEQYIQEVVINQLQFLADNTPNPDSVQYYLDQISVWQQTLALNESLKQSAIFDANYSVSGGAIFDQSTTSSSTESATVEFNTEIDNVIAASIGAEIAGNGLSGGTNITMRMDVGESETNTTTKTFTTQFHLEDDDVGDGFTVNVKKDPVYNTSVFELVSGVTSCPFEPGTQPRDEPQLVVVNPIQSGIAPGEKAEFTFQLRNISQSGEQRSYSLIFDQSSNPGGAQIEVGGTPYTVPVNYTIPYLGTIEVTVKVAQGASNIYSYEGLLFSLVPTCDGGDPRSEAAISAFFVSPCSEVALFAPNDGWIINGSSNILDIHIKDYEETDLDQIQVQLSPAGLGSWIPIMTLQPNDLNPNSPNTTNIGTLTSYHFLNFADGAYDIRLKLVCGSASIFSQRATGIIDRQAPLVFGVPLPADDHYESGDQIAVSFDEEIDCSDDQLLLTELVTGNTIAATFSCFQNTLTIQPSIDLTSLGDALFEVSLNQVADLFGNQNPKVSWKFRTGDYVYVPKPSCGELVLNELSIADGTYKGTSIAVQGIVPNLGNVILKSETVIDLGVDFEVKAGAIFTAKTNVPCNQP